jgi:hypothetical protein
LLDPKAFAVGRTLVLDEALPLVKAIQQRRDHDTHAQERDQPEGPELHAAKPRHARREHQQGYCGRASFKGAVSRLALTACTDPSRATKRMHMQTYDAHSRARAVLTLYSMCYYSHAL